MSELGRVLFFFYFQLQSPTKFCHSRICYTQILVVDGSTLPHLFLFLCLKI